MAIEFTLENVLAVVIGLITLNLLFIGFYIVSVLREVKKTVHRAGEVIDEVDQTVKDGIEKAKAMNAPMQALATTASALGGIIRGGDAIRKATQSILGGASEAEPETDTEVRPNHTHDYAHNHEPEFEPEMEPEVIKIESDRKKKNERRPRFFRKR